MYRDTTWDRVALGSKCLWTDGSARRWSVLKVGKNLGLGHDKKQEIMLPLSDDTIVAVEEV